MSGAVAFVVGLVFALGLGLGGMTQPTRVLAFLDVTGQWDPSLALVILGAVSIYALGFRLALRRGRPALAPAFLLPTRKDIDGTLLGGALVFGVGWGLAGLCPGPAITSLGSGESSAFLFVSAMLAGMSAHRLVAWVTARSPQQRSTDQRSYRSRRAGLALVPRMPAVQHERR